MDFHENWNTPDFDHDICMITLKEPFNLDDPNVQPIEFFQTSDAEIPAETVCNSTGWGLTNGNGKDREMNTVDLKKRNDLRIRYRWGGRFCSYFWVKQNPYL